ncbi:uncharacterized protein LOC112548521 isoform X2 [Alligator sinensis]|uniref:Uncharacterized protein LOC112548521 isoform X2 n=1 Tax=Alligator sinensis TaxID=38654 RepID=A0A3Q0FVY1_ALLSI|nr:uncharacterized protein LOC112548521 isoform X2 [Alligator sinensis]
MLLDTVMFIIIYGEPLNVCLSRAPINLNPPLPCFLFPVLSTEREIILGTLPAVAGLAAIIVYCCMKRRKGWAVPYSVSEVQIPEQCLLGQEVTLCCSMEGTFPKHVAVTWERIRSKYRTVPESAGDQEIPEHQPILPALPQSWRETEERAGTCLPSSLTFTPTLQDDGAGVQCTFLHGVKRIREERVSPEIRVWGECPETLLPPPRVVRACCCQGGWRCRWTSFSGHVEADRARRR